MTHARSSTASENPFDVAARYLAAWNEADPARRAVLVADAFAPDVEYRDPMMDGRGHAGIGELIGAVHHRFAGHRFTLHGTPEAHHDVVRFSWSLAAADTPPVARGTDVAEIDGEGRLRRVTGFLDYLATA
jgi:hypothetical protein